MNNPQESRLPAPAQLVIAKMNEMEVAEMIEKYINFFDPDPDQPDTGRSVHLQPWFVKHYMKRSDGALPRITAIAQLPIVLQDGSMIGGHGFDRRYGIYFAIPAELDPYLPTIEACTPDTVARAMHYLTDEWLVDVATSYHGKCQLIALALTIIERTLLSERPAFFVTAGQRGGGKTTTIQMISMAATGQRAAAAAWSGLEEERRKALYAYLGSGLQLLVWDNIARGTVIWCPSVERSLTTEIYSDRILSVTSTKGVPAYTVQVFTGNNVAPRSDLVSRSLQIRLEVDRPDPENRSFTHADPIARTDAHRGEILGALYTLLRGNPRRSQPPSERPPAPTRFKQWWEMIGSAVEYAASQHTQCVAGLTLDYNQSCPAKPIEFKKMFLEGEGDDQQTTSLFTVLTMLRRLWPAGCYAENVAGFLQRVYVNEPDPAELRSALETASGKSVKDFSKSSITWGLKAIVDIPVALNDKSGKSLVLRYARNRREGGKFTVAEIQPNS